MKLLCALVGHKWTETHSGEPFLGCSRCGAQHELSDELPSNYKAMARTTTIDQQSRVRYGGREDRN